MNWSDTMEQISAMSWKMHEPNTSVSCIVSFHKKFFLSKFHIDLITCHWPAENGTKRKTKCHFRNETTRQHFLCYNLIELYSEFSTINKLFQLNWCYMIVLWIWQYAVESNAQLPNDKKTVATIDFFYGLITVNHFVDVFVYLGVLFHMGADDSLNDYELITNRMVFILPPSFHRSIWWTWHGHHHVWLHRP